LLCDRKRRLGDKSLPHSLTNDPSFATDSKMYQDLLDVERHLDWQMMRKKAEIQDTLGRPSTVRAIELAESSVHMPTLTLNGL
jgi:SWI/SNF-related matrix-associated actin-dependent regulator of chromatin subfamily D